MAGSNTKPLFVTDDLDETIVEDLMKVVAYKNVTAYVKEIKKEVANENEGASGKDIAEKVSEKVKSTLRNVIKRKVRFFYGQTTRSVKSIMRTRETWFDSGTGAFNFVATGTAADVLEEIRLANPMFVVCANAEKTREFVEKSGIELSLKQALALFLLFPNTKGFGKSAAPTEEAQPEANTPAPTEEAQPSRKRQRKRKSAQSSGEQTQEGTPVLPEANTPVIQATNDDTESDEEVDILPKPGCSGVGKRRLVESLDDEENDPKATDSSDNGGQAPDNKGSSSKKENTTGEKPVFTVGDDEYDLVALQRIIKRILDDFGNDDAPLFIAELKRASTGNELYEVFLKKLSFLTADIQKNLFVAISEFELKESISLSELCSEIPLLMVCKQLKNAERFLDKRDRLAGTQYTDCVIFPNTEKALSLLNTPNNLKLSGDDLRTTRNHFKMTLFFGKFMELKQSSTVAELDVFDLFRGLLSTLMKAIANGDDTFMCNILDPLLSKIENKFPKFLHRNVVFWKMLLITPDGTYDNCFQLFGAGLRSLENHSITYGENQTIHMFDMRMDIESALSHLEGSGGIFHRSHIENLIDEYLVDLENPTEFLQALWNVEIDADMSMENYIEMGRKLMPCHMSRESPPVNQDEEFIDLTSENTQENATMGEAAPAPSDFPMEEAAPKATNAPMVQVAPKATKAAPKATNAPVVQVAPKATKAAPAPSDFPMEEAAPKASDASMVQVAPKATKAAPKAPDAPVVQVAPKAPDAPVVQVAPEAPDASKADQEAPDVPVVQVAPKVHKVTYVNDVYIVEDDLKKLGVTGNPPDKLGTALYNIVKYVLRDYKSMDSRKWLMRQKIAEDCMFKDWAQYLITQEDGNVHVNTRAEITALQRKKVGTKASK